MKRFALACVACALGCGDDGGGGGAIDAAGATADARASVDAAPLPDAAPGGPLFSETFDTNAGAWPSPWSVAGGVLSHDVVGQRGRLVPIISGYSLARMKVPVSAVDFDVTFAVEFAELTSQGLGFYVRQNGGYLMDTDPTGAGYAVFLEGFRGNPAIGVWREVGGVEQSILIVQNPIAGVTSNVTYEVRFQVEQDGANTHLRARMWPRGESEPTAWQVDTTDSTASLQSLAGGIAVDAWSNYSQDGDSAADVFFDDLVVRELGN